MLKVCFLSTACVCCMLCCKYVACNMMFRRQLAVSLLSPFFSGPAVCGAQTLSVSLIFYAD